MEIKTCKLKSKPSVEKNANETTLITLPTYLFLDSHI